MNNLYNRTILSFYLRNYKIIQIISIGFLSLFLIITSTYFLKDESNEAYLKKEDGNSVKKRLPDFFIVGVKKSGTTTLGKSIKKKMYKKEQITIK